MTIGLGPKEGGLKKNGSVDCQRGERGFGSRCSEVEEGGSDWRQSQEEQGVPARPLGGGGSTAAAGGTRLSGVTRARCAQGRRRSHSAAGAQPTRGRCRVPSRARSLFDPPRRVPLPGGSPLSVRPSWLAPPGRAEPRGSPPSPKKDRECSCRREPAKARTGFEPVIFGLRDRRLTTWPPRLR